MSTFVKPRSGIQIRNSAIPWREYVVYPLILTLTFEITFHIVNQFKISLISVIWICVWGMFTFAPLFCCESNGGEKRSVQMKCVKDVVVAGCIGLWEEHGV